MSPRRNWDSPNPFLASECAPPPRTGEGGRAHLPAGEGLGESQFRRLEKKLSLCLLCAFAPPQFITIPSGPIHDTGTVYYTLQANRRCIYCILYVRSNGDTVLGDTADSIWLHKAIMVLLLTPIILDIRMFVYLKRILRQSSLTKQRNAIIIVLYFLSALGVINETCCCTVGARTEAEFMNVQFR